MITKEYAKKIGLNACIKKIGSSFDKKFASSACGTEPQDNKLFCFVGVDKRILPINDSTRKVLTLDSTSKFAFSASCNVSLHDGTVEFLECHVPSR